MNSLSPLKNDFMKKKRQHALNQLDAETIRLSEVEGILRKSTFADDKAIITKLVSKCPEGIQYASERLKADEDVASACLKYTGYQLYLSDIKKNPDQEDFLYSCLNDRYRETIRSLSFISDKVKNNPNFIFKHIKHVPWLVPHYEAFENIFKGEQRIIMESLKWGNSRAINVATIEQLNNYDFIKESLKICPDVLNFIPAKWLHYSEFVRKILDVKAPSQTIENLVDKLDQRSWKILTNVLIEEDPSTLNKVLSSRLSECNQELACYTIRETISSSSEKLILKSLDLVDYPQDMSAISELMINVLQKDTLLKMETKLKWYEDIVIDRLQKIRVYEIEGANKGAPSKPRKLLKHKPF